jgi:5-hydroxyisourate hydrolase
MAKITTHVLDISRGRPAAGVAVTLESGGKEQRAVTDDDGRVKTFDEVGAGTHTLTFDIGAHYAKLGQDTFYPHAQISFVVKDAAQHFHVPLLLSPFGFSTYRGS